MMHISGIFSLKTFALELMRLFVYLNVHNKKKVLCCRCFVVKHGYDCRDNINAEKIGEIIVYAVKVDPQLWRTVARLGA